MATTFVEYTGDGQASKQFTFPSYQESDVKVRVDGDLKTSGTHYNITGYTTTGGGNVVFIDNSGSGGTNHIPSSPANIRIYRDTNVDSAKATFTAGSSVKAADLNNNTTQLLYRAQEEQIPNLIHSYDIDDSAIETSKIKADAVTGAKIADDQINSEHYVDGSIDTAHIANDAITEAKIANDALTGANMAVGTITTAILADGLISTVKIANDAVTSAKIADDQINSEHYVDGSIDTAHIADLQVTTAKIAADAITGAKIADDAIDSEHIAADSLDTEHYASGSIDATAIGNAAIQTAKIADTAVSTAKIADNAVTTGKIADSNVTTAKIAADAITGAKIADDQINSEHYVDGSIDTAHIGDSQVTTAKIADANITSAKIASNAVTTDKIADSELSTLAGMQSTTASNLASSTALTATTAELNQLDGITLETSVTTNSDTRIPTSKAVNDLVLSVTNALGGFVAIANETSFPTANPDPSNNAGTVVSISQLSTGLAVNSSGVATISNGAGSGNTVTITGFPSNLQSQTLPASSGLQVQTTSTLHTYTFHKQLASAADIQAISATVNSFSNRYRVSASAPTSSLDGGDLWYDTTNSKLMVYSSQNSAWEESSAIGNFFISTISSSSSTGGGSATPNGTAYRFTISDAPTTAAACIVSVDGVIQKPNSGSSQPSEGFVLVGNDIIFGAAPANGASLFVTVIGSTVGIGTPSDNTVTTAILQNGSVTTAKITDANVTTAKIADDAVTAAKLANTSVSAGSYGSSTSIPSITVDAQGRITAASGNTVNTDLVADTSPQLGGDLASNGNDIILADADKLKLGSGSDLQIYHDGSHSFIEDLGTGDLKIRSNGGAVIIAKTDGENAARFLTDGTVELYHNNSKKFETTATGATVTGNLTASGASNQLGNTTIIGGGGAGGVGLAVEYNSSDVWSVNNVGTVSMTGHLDLQDNDIIKIGSGDDLQIYHDGTDSYLDNTTGELALRGATIRLRGNPQNNETLAVFEENGAAKLYYDNSKKFETTSAGATLTGNLTTTSSITIQNANHLFLADNGKARFGANQDLEIYHDGSSSYISDVGTGSLKITTNGTGVDIQKESSETIARFIADGAVELYHNNVKKFNTFDSGVVVSGDIQIYDGSELQMGSSSDFKIFHDGNNNYIKGVNNDFIYIATNNSNRWSFANDGHFRPEANNTYDIGSTAQRVRNIYTNDLHLSNEGHSNDVDGTWGNWTIQEGESDLFLKNNRSGKKYKFNLTEVS